MLAIAFWVLKTTGSSAQMGIVLSASLIPSLIIGLFSGAFIDRYHRKPIIIGTDLFRGIIIGGFSILFYLDTINLPIVVIMQVLLSINAAFFDPAIPAIIPTIVKKNDLARANAMHQFVGGFATIAGALLGGILVSMIGYLLVFIINALSFIGSALIECFIHIPRTQRCHVRQPHILHEMKQGYDYIFSTPGFLVLLFMVMIIHFFVGSIEIIMPVMADRISNAGAKTLGYFQAAFGAGTIIATFFLSTFIQMNDEKSWLFGAVFLIGVIYIMGSMIDPSHPNASLFFLSILFSLGGCIICAAVAFRTLLQKRIENSYAGRIFAVAGTLGNASIPAAMILYGFLMERILPSHLLLISGFMLIPISMISYVFYKKDNVGMIREKDAS